MPLRPSEPGVAPGKQSRATGSLKQKSSSEKLSGTNQTHFALFCTTLLRRCSSAAPGKPCSSVVGFWRRACGLNKGAGRPGEGKRPPTHGKLRQAHGDCLVLPATRGFFSCLPFPRLSLPHDRSENNSRNCNMPLALRHIRK